MNIPFLQSYWLMPDKVLCGHFPSDLDPVVRETKLQGLLDAGIRTIINLIPEDELGNDDIPFDDYTKWMESNGHRIICMRHGFKDRTAPSVELMQRIQREIEVSVLHDCPVYLHCWGGHGRSAMVAVCHLISLGSPLETALEYVLNLRKPLPKNHYPFEPCQVEFIREWAKSKS